MFDSIGESSQPAKATTKNNIDRWTTGVGAVAFARQPGRHRRGSSYGAGEQVDACNTRAGHVSWCW